MPELTAMEVMQHDFLDPTLKKASYRDIHAKGPCDLRLVDL